MVQFLWRGFGGGFGGLTRVVCVVFFEAANREICRLFVLVDCFGAEIEERSLVGQKASFVGMTT